MHQYYSTVPFFWVLASLVIMITVTIVFNYTTVSEYKLHRGTDQILGVLHGKCPNEFEPREGASSVAR